MRKKEIRVLRFFAVFFLLLSIFSGVDQEINDFESLYETLFTVILIVLAIIFAGLARIEKLLVKIRNHQIDKE